MKKITSYLVAVFALATMALAGYSSEANAAESVAGNAAPVVKSIMADIKMVTGRVVSATPSVDPDGFTRIRIIVEKGNGQTVELLCCCGNCPELQPNGPACPTCAQHCTKCLELLNGVTGTDTIVQFVTCYGYIQGWCGENGDEECAPDGSNVHCFRVIN